jgi:hypothetical protein
MCVMLILWMTAGKAGRLQKGPPQSISSCPMRIKASQKFRRMKSERASNTTSVRMCFVVKMATHK